MGYQLVTKLSLELTIVYLFSQSHWAADVFRTRFPGLAQRVIDAQASLERQGFGNMAKPPYGYWYNYCINGPRNNVKGVFCKPHVDGKNLAVMLCGVFVYGQFM